MTTPLRFLKFAAATVLGLSAVTTASAQDKSNGRRA